jgi:hypothetical protein
VRLDPHPSGIFGDEVPTYRLRDHARERLDFCSVEQTAYRVQEVVPVEWKRLPTASPKGKHLRCFLSSCVYALLCSQTSIFSLAGDLMS